MKNKSQTSFRLQRLGFTVLRRRKESKEEKKRKKKEDEKSKDQCMYVLESNIFWIPRALVRRIDAPLV